MKNGEQGRSIRWAWGILLASAFVVAPLHSGFAQDKSSSGKKTEAPKKSPKKKGEDGSKKKPEVKEKEPGPSTVKKGTKGDKGNSKPKKAPSLPKALKIMKLRASKSLPKDERSVIDIRVEENGRFDRTRSLIRYVLRKDGKEKSMFRFTSPSTFRNLAVLTIESKDGDDKQWMYIPSRRKVKRVARSQSIENFAGSGFSFEDLRAEALDGHSYKTLARKKVQGRPTYVIESRPKKDEVRALKAYSKRLLYIDTERFVIMRVDFFNKKGDLVKIQENSRWSVVGGVYRPYRAKMKELTKNRTTWIRFRTWAANEGLPSKLFTTRELMREGGR